MATWGDIPAQEVYSGQAVNLDLVPYLINRGSGVPTIVTQPSGATWRIDTSGGGVRLVGTAPSTASEINISCQLSIADSRYGTQFRTIVYLVHGATLPAFQTIPDQGPVEGQAWNFNFRSYVSGSPAPHLTLDSGLAYPSWLRLVGSVLSGTPPVADYSYGDSFEVGLVATNIVGTARVTFHVRIVATSPPQAGFSGENWTFDLSADVPSIASDTDSYSFRPGFTAPPWLILSGTTLSASPLPGTASATQDDTYTIPIRVTRTNSVAHTTVMFDFNVPLTVKWTELPRWVSIPPVVLDEPVSPTNPRAELVTSSTLNLHQYIGARAGTVSFSLGSDAPAWAVLSDDTLTLTAPHVGAADDNGRETFHVLLHAQNSVGTADMTLVVEVNKLVLPVFSAIPNQTVYRNETDSLNLADFVSGTPAPLFALGTAVPAFSQVFVTSNADGHWTIAPFGYVTQTRTYTVNVIATNRVGITNGSFQLEVRAEDSPSAPSAPVWKSTESLFTFDVDAGAMLPIGLTVLLASARPSPTYTLADDADLTSFNAQASILSSNLTFHAPPLADVTSDFSIHFGVVARNSAGASQIELTFNIRHVALPDWELPAQTWHVGEAGTLRLADFVSAIPDVTAFAFQAGYTAPSWLSLSNGVLSGTPPVATYSDETSLSVLLNATNAAGTTPVTLTLNISVVTAPVWVADDIFFELVEAHTEVFNLEPFLSAGAGTAILSLEPGEFQTDLNVFFDGLQLRIVQAPSVEFDTMFPLSVRATTAEGHADKDVEITVIARLSDSQELQLTQLDYDQVRSLIGEGITTQELPDIFISRPVFEEAAIDHILKETPFEGTGVREPINVRRQRRAVLYRCAGIVAPTMPQLLSESVGGFATRFENVGWAAKQQILFALAQTEIQAIRDDERDDEDPDDTNPKSYSFFVVT